MRLRPWLFAVLAVGLAAATAEGRTRTRATMTPRAASARPHPPSGGRTLDDIHIEGEIPVPQVLFITARDQRRFMEFQYRRYLRTSREVGDAAALPTRLVVPAPRPALEREVSR